MPMLLNIQPTCAWTNPRTAPQTPGLVADVRRMRVALLVRERVMLAVIGHPLRDRALHRHAAEDAERDLHRLPRLEAAMREVAVEADRRPERAQHVEDEEQQQVDGVERDAPQHAHRRQQRQRRHHDGDHGDYLAEAARVRADGADRQGRVQVAVEASALRPLSRA